MFSVILVWCVSLWSQESVFPNGGFKTLVFSYAWAWWIFIGVTLLARPLTAPDCLVQSQDLHTWRTISIFTHNLLLSKPTHFCYGGHWQWPQPKIILLCIPAITVCVAKINCYIHFHRAVCFGRWLFFVRAMLTVFWTYYKYPKVNISLTRTLLGFCSECVCCGNLEQITVIGKLEWAQIRSDSATVTQLTCSAIIVRASLSLSVSQMFR